MEKQLFEHDYNTLTTVQMRKKYKLGYYSIENLRREYGIKKKPGAQVKYENLPTKESLQKAYSFGVTQSDLSKIFNIPRHKIKQLLNKYDIEIKTIQQACSEKFRNKVPETPSREILYKLHIVQNKSISDLRQIYNIGQETAYSWLKQRNIKPITLSQATKIAKTKQFKHLQFEKNVLERYNGRKLHYDEIAKELNCSPGHIHRLFDKYEIKSKAPLRFSSKMERELFELCQRLRPDVTWLSGDRKLIYPYELDIVSPELNLAIEYGGIYWHSQISGNKDKNYHKMKMELCRGIGIDLITIFDTDNIDIVKQNLMHRLGKSTKIGARKCTITKMNSSNAKKFHETFHLSKYVGSSEHYGLTYRNELLQVMSFSRSRFNKQFELECTRNTIKSGTAVVGGTSRLIKHIGNRSLITYSDLRFGQGKSYELSGMIRQKDSAPNFWYFHPANYSKLYSRINFQKHKLEKMEIYDKNMTGWEIMKANGWDRIFDCGNGVYTKKRGKQLNASLF